MRTRFVTVTLLLLLIFISTSGCDRQRLNNQEKTVAVRILFDEGHHNSHTTHISKRLFVDVLRKEGYEVVPLAGEITQEALDGFQLFITANPFPQIRDSLLARARADSTPFRYHPDATKPAFTEQEASIIEVWVRNGGALLVFADHAPHGETLRPLVEPFGIELANVETLDSSHADPRWDNPFWILFTRDNGLIKPHPITEGVDSVVTMLGQSIIGPAGSQPLLALSSTAVDREYSFDKADYLFRSAAGRAQGVALEVEAGRVVVFGESGMLRGWPEDFPDSMSDEEVFIRPGNLQLGLNTIAWLTSNNCRSTTC